MYKRINEIFPDWLSSGIFSKLELFDVPWKGLNIYNSLDIAYHGGKSGNKIISPLLENFLNESGELTESNLTKIAESIFVVYGKNWSKLWETLNFDYDPIENYRMTETEHTDGTNSGEISGSISENDEKTNSKNVTLNETGIGETKLTGTTGNEINSTSTNTATNNNSVYGFNSNGAVNSDTQNGNSTTTNETNETLTDNRTETEKRNFKNETIESESGNVTRSSNNSETKSSKSLSDRTLTRSGNIGVTTSQQMIQSERELWNWFFYDIVFNNIDAVLTLSIY